jgi:hypothetical protein
MQLLADYLLAASVDPDDNIKLAICSQTGQDNFYVNQKRAPNGTNQSVHKMLRITSRLEMQQNCTINYSTEYQPLFLPELATISGSKTQHARYAHQNRNQHFTSCMFYCTSRLYSLIA